MRSFAPRVDKYLSAYPAKRRPGLRLKFFRVSIGYSQRELGEFLGLSRSTISGMELGRSIPNLKMLTKLHNTMQLSTDSILYDGEALDERTIRGYDTLTTARR